MMAWMIGITVALGMGAWFVIHNAQMDDKRRKLQKRPNYDNY